MNDELLLFDALMAATIIAIAVGALVVKDHFQAIVLFIIFGLLMALVWCRLDAVDVALAEAAIGAGLTGALLLNTLAAIGGVKRPASYPMDNVASKARPVRIVLSTLAVAAAAAVATIVLPIAASTGPRIELLDALPHTGADNPVTAVLLNLRAYDTLLEIAVLVLAAFGVVSIRPATTAAPDARAAGPVLRSFVGLAVPLIALVAVYMLWIGSKLPGGAFQAGALGSAAGVLLLVSGAHPPAWLRRSSAVLLLVGIVVFLLAGLAPMPLAGRFLEYRDQEAALLILVIETALTISIAWILIMLFAGGFVGSAVEPSATQSEADQI
jgi:multisubunit Na+/H+ antiporter MnhB subunit